MIGIFLFWLAFSPVQPAPERAAVSSQEQLQRQKDRGRQRFVRDVAAAEQQLARVGDGFWHIGHAGGHGRGRPFVRAA